MRAAFWVHAASPIAYLVQAVLQTSQLQRILRAIQSNGGHALHATY